MQTNVEVKRYNRTLDTRLRQNYSEHQRDWHTYVWRLPYSRITYTQTLKGTSPFSAILPREMPSAASLTISAVAASKTQRKWKHGTCSSES